MKEQPNFRNCVAGEPLQHENGRLQAMLEHARRTPVQTLDPESDDEFRALVRHVLHPGERLMEFQQRTGLGKGTITAQKMTREDISRFVELAGQNAKDDPAAPSATWQPKRAPAHFTLD